jgi:hypothetical protein
MWRSARATIVMTAIAVGAVWFALATIRGPFAHNGIPSGHDATAHINYAYRFDRALGEGQFPVRWVEGYEPGRGQPLFSFYQVGFYYAVELVHAFIPDFLRAYKLTPVYVWWAAALFMFLALRRLGTLPAALGAVVFAISPYLIFDTLERSAYPEFVGIAAGAGALWGIDSLLASGRMVYVPITAALVGALLVSHLPTAMMLSAMFAIHVLAMLWSGETEPRRLLPLAGACALGACLAAFYVLPALGELSLIQIRSLTQGSFDFHRYFMSPTQWFDFAWRYGTSLRDPNDYMPLQVGVVEWAAILPAGVIVIDDVLGRRTASRTVALGSGLAIAGVGMLMATAASRPIWDHLPPLAFVQYPWRFLMLLPFAGAFLSARLLTLLPDRKVQSLAVIAVVAFELLIYAPAMQAQFYIPTTLIDPDNPQWPSSAEAKREYIEPGYFPAGVTIPLKPAAERWVLHGDGTIRELFTTDAHRVFESSGERDLTMTLNTPYFPGWTIRVDGAVREPRVHPGDAFMEIAVPPGTHHIDASFENTPIRRWANVVTCVSALAVLLLFAWAVFATVRSH